MIGPVRVINSNIGAPASGGEATSSGTLSNSASVLLNVFGDAAATTFNPFNTDINTVRGQETGYATLNPLKVSDTSSIVLSDGNLRVDITGNYYNAVSTLGMSSGKFYCEISPVRGYSYFGIATGDVVTNTWGGDQTNNTAWVLHTNGSIYHNNATTNGTGFPTPGTSGGYTLGLLFDADNKTMRYVDKGAVSKVYNMANTVDGDLFYFFVGGDAGSYEIDVNFGQKPFKFPPPDGFQPLNAANIRPETVIPRSDQFVGITTWRGNDTQRDISTLNMKPDLVWIKQRTGSANHSLMDTVRGATKNIVPNDTQGEGTETGYLNAFIDNGFSLGTSSIVNDASNDYVAWAWKAGGNKNTFNVDDVGYASASDVGMNVGGQNDNAYNKSQTWSSNVSGGSGAYGAAANAFNGNLSNYASPEYSSAMTYTNPSASDTVIDTFEIYGRQYSTSITLELNDTDIKSQLSTTVTWHNITGFSGQTFNKLYWRPTSGNLEVRIYAIRINGKILVDTSVTPPDAPSTANTGASVGTKQGFSIVKFTNDSTSPITLSHGLTQAPTFVLLKALTGSVGWTVGHTSIGFTKRLKLNGTDAESASANFFFDSPPSDSLITLGANNVSNDFIMYSWHDVPGLQKFGSYEGNNDNDGVFVELGFRPSILLIKRVDNTDDWFLYDGTRRPINVNSRYLRPNSTAVENTGDGAGTGLDLLSNGFKIRSDSSAINAAETYIYAAWAEAPTVDLYGGGANAR